MLTLKPNELVVGNKIFVIPDKAFDTPPFEAMITKIGRKYAYYCKYGVYSKNEHRINLATMQAETDANNRTNGLWDSKEAYNQYRKKASAEQS